MRINVSVVAPDEKEKEFTGEIKVINIGNTDDFCTIPVSLTTHKNKTVTNLPIQIFNRLTECFSALIRLLNLRRISV